MTINKVEDRGTQTDKEPGAADFLKEKNKEFKDNEQLKVQNEAFINVMKL